MRIVRALIVPLLTIAVIILLNTPFGGLPALGRLLDPVNGWGANAEPTDKNFSLNITGPGLEQPVTVWFEDRLVPHIHAGTDHDLYFVQGFIHAYFRLWQMDMQTRAAAGRIGEVVGEKWVTDATTGERRNVILEFDRGQRRKGMVYAAENSLKAMEAEPRTRTMLDAYTAGINSYISSLHFKDWPLEYKLMGFEPERWTNLKCALLLKYMADDLTGYTEDIPLTILKDKLTQEDLDLLYPERINGSMPVIPQGTKFDAPSLIVPAAPQQDIWTRFNLSAVAVNHQILSVLPDDGIGSNNWAISGSKTVSGAPILCNDPHLGLNLPSLWFEMQLQAPNINVYGVSLPGAPGIIIGFNDSLSWGLTNNYRDVKDFYEIEGIDKDFYRFDGKPQPYDKRDEIIKIKGGGDIIDTVAYTIHGPVMYDSTFPEPSGTGKRLAMCWMAHRGTNELLSIYLLNRAGTYMEFTEAILHFECPAQNFVYADRGGNIALWGQGQFINKWKDQGRYVMKGNTSLTLWGKDIPMLENPHALNPQQGYLASANQITTDTTYPYWYNGYFYDFRAWRINEILSMAKLHSIQDEMLMQNDEVSVLARNSFPVLNNIINNGQSERRKSWNFDLAPESKEAAEFQILWTLFYDKLWSSAMNYATLYPSPERTMQLLRQDSAGNKYYQAIRVAVEKASRLSADSLTKMNHTAWYKVKATQLTHLAKIDAFSYKELKIGGWGNTINAAKKTHGPSWRMIVELGKDSIRAYGVYPGGQSGNPGSKYYGTFINNWVEGRYYPLAFLPNQSQQILSAIKYTWTIQPRK